MQNCFHQGVVLYRSLSFYLSMSVQHFLLRWLYCRVSSSEFHWRGGVRKRFWPSHSLQRALQKRAGNPSRRCDIIERGYWTLGIGRYIIGGKRWTTRSHTKVVVGVYGELILARNQYSRRAKINLNKTQILSLTWPWYSVISYRVMLVVPKNQLEI